MQRLPRAAVICTVSSTERKSQSGPAFRARPDGPATGLVQLRADVERDRAAGGCGSAGRGCTTVTCVAPLRASIRFAAQPRIAGDVYGGMSFSISRVRYRNGLTCLRVMPVPPIRHFVDPDQCPQPRVRLVASCARAGIIGHTRRSALVGKTDKSMKQEL